MPKPEYLESYKENNLEHIYGNDRFQVFINHNNTALLKRKEN
ncbi:MAG: hypothetical protein RSG52_15390 [Terrisporobacter sp.]